MPLRTVLTAGVATLSAAAGAIHLTAASAHAEHELVLAFFVTAGISQIVWAGGVLAPGPGRRLLVAGALGNLALIAVWLASRLSGLPFVPGAEHAEPVGVKDASAVGLELLVAGGALVLAHAPAWLSADPRIRAARVAPAAAAAAVLLVPGLVAPAHEHADGHDHEHAGLTAEHVHGADLDGHNDGHAHTSAAPAAAAHGHGERSGDGGHALTAHGSHTSHTPHASHASRPPAQRTTRADARVVTDPPEPKGIRTTLRYGPFVLPPADAGGEAHYNRILTNVARPCSDCYIVGMDPGLVYADGTSANLDTGAMLHHAVWTRPAYTDHTCGRGSSLGPAGLRFFASGNERTRMRLPEGFGYHVGNDSWTLIAEIMNHAERPQTVYISLDVVHRAGSEDLRRVTPVWLDVDNCGDSEYAIPAGESSQLWTWTSTLTGRVVSTAGHVHDGGIKTVLSNESRKERLCSSVAGYGSDPAFAGSIESMSMCVWDRLGVVRRGEVLSLRAYYDSSQPQDDVMGIMIAMVYETEDLAGGSPPPQGGQPAEQEPPPVHDHG